jgi:dihydroorotase
MNISVMQNVLQANDQIAEENRRLFKKNHNLVLNLMSSPGAGKTSLLEKTAELLRGFDATFKVNPPLRTISDIDALKAGVLDGTIDAIATDHAPHARRDKELPLDQAPPGMLGLETALGVTCAALDLDPLAIAQVMSVAPARIAGIADRQGNLPRVGVAANLCFVDLNATWMINPETMASKSTNTPFVGRQLRGKVVHTMFNGDLVVRDGEALK